MSVPSGLLRYAGIWNAASTYVLGDFVESSLISNSFAALQTVTGGSDPSVALAPNWVAFPATSGGTITSVVAGTGLSGGGNSGSVTLANDGVLELTQGGNISITGTKANYTITGQNCVISLNGLENAVSLQPDTNTALEITTDSLNNSISTTYLPGSVGIYTEAVGGLLAATITATACQTGWVVQLTYVHTGGGGGSQYIKNIVTAAGSFTVTCNTAIDIGDKIIWHVVGAPN